MKFVLQQNNQKMLKVKFIFRKIIIVIIYLIIGRSISTY